jgi:hypothetical protein
MVSAAKSYIYAKHAIGNRGHGRKTPRFQWHFVVSFVLLWIYPGVKALASGEVEKLAKPEIPKLWGASPGGGGRLLFVWRGQFVWRTFIFNEIYVR